MRWDSRSPTGGCVPSMIAGVSSPNYVTQSGDTSCKLDVKGTELQCKYDEAELTEHYDKTVNVWRKVLPRGRIDYFMDSFCLPSITSEQLEMPIRNALLEAHQIATTEMTEYSLNVALNRPATMSSENYWIWKHKASFANDGDKNHVWLSSLPRK